jgi:hypothetical protein
MSRFNTVSSAVLAMTLLLSLSGVATADEHWEVTGRFAALIMEGEERCFEGEDGEQQCLPTAGSMAILSDGRVLYWDALANSEAAELNAVAEGGMKIANDTSRVMDFTDGYDAEPTWSTPENHDGGANPEGYDYEPLLPGGLTLESDPRNDGGLFCSDLVQLGDGRVLAVGGTAWYNEPGVDELGLIELEGLRNGRVYDPVTNEWTQTGDLAHGRWYPTMVTLPSSEVLVASGVRKLIKPFYPDRDPTESGRNIIQTETLNPDTLEWETNPESADRSLPLYPRLHLLPNGQVFYNAVGQVFNPAGYAYDQLEWNYQAVYDPQSKTWEDLDIPGVGTLAPGFRGSTMSVMLPLKAPYDSATFLTAGGIIGTTPGTYIATDHSRLTTVDTSGEDLEVTEAETGPLSEPRWYSQGVLLPDGSVLAVNGADRDEVVGPGTGFPIEWIERFDPATNEWERLIEAQTTRTYHNTAALLPDGRVLIGGHAPIPTLYGVHTTLPGGFSDNEGRKAEFDIYEPPYLFRGDRPVITSVGPQQVNNGQPFAIGVDSSREIESVVLIRNPSVTHIIDADQRAVELAFTETAGSGLWIHDLPDTNVLPPGPYMLFVNAASSDGPIPSEAMQVIVTG